MQKINLGKIDKTNLNTNSQLVTLKDYRSKIGLQKSIIPVDAPQVYNSKENAASNDIVETYDFSAPSVDNINVDTSENLEIGSEGVLEKSNINFDRISANPNGEFVKVNENYFGDDGDLRYKINEDSTVSIYENDNILGYTDLDGIGMTNKVIVNPIEDAENQVETKSFDETEDVIIDIPDNSWDGPVIAKGIGTVMGPSGRETYYNQNSLIPKHFDIHTYQGEELHNSMERLGLEYPRDYHVSDYGVDMLGQYVMCAADVVTSDRKKGDILDTSLGKAIIVDHCEAAQSEPGLIDISVQW